MNENQIQAAVEAIQAYKENRKVEARLISGIGSIQRSARRGKEISQSQKEYLERDYNASVFLAKAAQEKVQAFANNFLE